MPPRNDLNPVHYLPRIPARVQNVYEVCAHDNKTGELITRGKWRAFTMKDAEKAAFKFFSTEWRLKEFYLIGHPVK